MNRPQRPSTGLATLAAALGLLAAPSLWAQRSSAPVPELPAFDKSDAAKHGFQIAAGNQVAGGLGQYPFVPLHILGDRVGIPSSEQRATIAGIGDDQDMASLRCADNFRDG